jgi:serine/threonine protein kinase
MDDFDGTNYSSFDSRRQKQIMFTDFVSKLLTIDPDARPTADEALKHPWMNYAATLTEEQIKYPSS